MSIKKVYRPSLVANDARDQKWIDSFAALSADAFIAVDEGMKLRFLNPAAARLFGREISESLDRPLQSLGYLGAILSPYISTVLQTQKVCRESFEVPSGDDILVFEGSFNPALAEDAPVKGVFAVLRDVTKSHALADELALSKERLETQSRALEVYDIVSETDLTGRIIYVNDRFCEMSGYSKEEWIGSDYRQINSGYHSRAFFKRLWRKIGRGEIWTGEIKNIDKEGETFWCHTIIAPLFDDDGKLDRFLSMQRDITKKREKLERAEQFVRRFNQILQNSHSMIISTDLRGCIVFANSAFLKTCDYTAQEIQGKPWIDTFIPADQRKQVQRLWLEAASRRSESQFETSVMGSGLESREVIWNLSPLMNEDAEVFGMTLVGEDVTEKRSTQEAMDHLQKDVKERTENLLSFVSHQLKNGLLSVDAGLVMIAEELESSDLDRSRIQGIIGKIKKRVSDLEGFSKELLQNFSESRGSMRIKLQSFSLKSLLFNIYERFKSDYHDKNIDFQIDVPRQDIIVCWDMLKVDELLTNLLSNAAKYLKTEGGRIEIKCRKINENILMSVSDNGIGIPPDSLESLFEWFSRGTVSHKKKREGFGVGLKFSKEVVSRHEGRIWLESKPDVGTSFHCLLPIDPKKKKKSS